MIAFLQRVWVALDSYETTDAAPAPGPVMANAALGMVLFHVVRCFAQDRKLLASWLDEGARRPS